MREYVIQSILDTKLIAIVRGMKEDVMLPLAKALIDGGMNMIEVTFNQSNPASFESTANAITAIIKEFGKDVVAGAGTVCTMEQLKMANDAGAKYIITPVCNPELIKEVRRLGLVAIPGVLTPTECLEAHDAGADFCKLFPIGNMGPGYLKAISAPLNHLKFLAVGGITEKNAKEYLNAGASGFGIGGHLLNKEWIDAGEFGKITALTRKFVEAVKHT